MIHNILKDKSTRLFIILAGFFIANAMIAEFMGVKIFSLEDSWGFSGQTSICLAASSVFTSRPGFCFGRWYLS
jgi:hypothetical protein